MHHDQKPLKAVKWGHALHQKFNEGHHCLDCANLYAKQQAYVKAERYYQKATYLLKRDNCQYAAIYSLRGLGIVRYRLQQTRSGIQLISQAATAYCDYGHRYEEASTLALLGQLYNEQQHYAFALACYEAVSEICAEFPVGHGYHGLKAAVQTEMAQICIKTGHIECALPYYLEALKLYEDMGFVSKMVEACAALAQNYEELAQFMTALHYRQRIILLRSLKYPYCG